MNLTKYAVGVGCASLLAISAQANTIYEIGQVAPGTPADLASDLIHIQDLVALYNAHPTTGSTETLPTGPSGHNEVYTIEKGSSVPTPPPSLTTPTSGSGPFTTGTGGESLTITLTSTLYDYLTVKWGQDMEAYYIKGLTGTITVTDDIVDPGKGGGSSGYELWDPTPGLVPDGGTTVLLLGAALSGLGLIRRKLS